ncbi:hypothetical protein ABI_27720 [Asticcacaulis biprosthecium C19]|uniref:Uncharacterized protein n=1 Tax=Asticcacaulis biprosthecium C19 TaxID=715226 RepID=F4QMB6_9CAUL|nr:hypothetical protein ABI_27720 [Asticcacaulis biprosthecium C19]
MVQDTNNQYITLGWNIENGVTGMNETAHSILDVALRFSSQRIIRQHLKDVDQA